jgi:uncharacterized protein
MKWLLAGASGFLGTAIRVRLATEGHEVVHLVRRKPATSTEVGWDPCAGELDPSCFEGIDIVVNLGGVPVAPRPWTKSRREQILASRVNSTSTISRVSRRIEPAATSRSSKQAVLPGTARRLALSRTPKILLLLRITWLS